MADDASFLPGLSPVAGKPEHVALDSGQLTSDGGVLVLAEIERRRSVREWALRQGWAGRPVRHEQAQGILIAALGVLAAEFGCGEARRAS